MCGRRQLHGWVSNHYTEHLQTDKKTKPSGTNGNFCFPFSSCTLSPLTSPLECRRRRVRVGTRPFGLPRPRLSQPHTHSRARRHAQVRPTIETPQLRGRPDTQERLSSPGSRSQSSHREPSNPRGLGASIFGHLSTLLVSKLPENWPTQGNEMHSHSWVTLPSRTILRTVTRDGP